MSKIILPKKDKDGNQYISYSQHSKWKKSIKDYVKSYFFGERFEGNAYTEFGSLIGESLENDDYSEFTENEQLVLEGVTRLDEFERQIKFDLGEFYVMGFIDTNDKACTTIVDYKTGDLNKVAVYEDDDYDQLAIYAGALEQETGKLPKKAWVELIERTGNAFRGETLKLGTSVVQIPQDISKKRIKAVKEDVVRVATEISDFYRVFNLMNEEISI